MELKQIKECGEDCKRNREEKRCCDPDCAYEQGCIDTTDLILNQMFSDPPAYFNATCQLCVDTIKRKMGEL